MTAPFLQGGDKPPNAHFTNRQAISKSGESPFRAGLYHPPQTRNLLPVHKQSIPNKMALQPKIWTTLVHPILTVPGAHLKLTWHLRNTGHPNSPDEHWVNPVIISILFCKSIAASAFLDPPQLAKGNSSIENGSSESGETVTHGGGVLTGDEILLRTKFDLDAHEERYEYLSETVHEPVFAGESIDAVTEFVVPERLGRYWGCFKVLHEKGPEFYCAFRYRVPRRCFPCPRFHYFLRGV